MILFQVEGLETEVSALKTLVLTSTPSQPNRHLHPQLVDLKASKKANKKVLSKTANGDSSDSLHSSGVGSSRNSNSLPSDGRTGSGSMVVVGGGGVISRSPSSLVSSSSSSVAGVDHDVVRRLHLLLHQSIFDNVAFPFQAALRSFDPTLRKDFLSWRKEPTLDPSHPFLAKIYREDVEPCMTFPNKRLAQRVKIVLKY